MLLNIDLPSDLEQSLRASVPDFDQRAKELLLVSLYRDDQLSHHQLATILGLTRYETDGVLKRHGVTEDLLTVEELAAQVDSLSGLVTDG